MVVAAHGQITSASRQPRCSAVVDVGKRVGLARVEQHQLALGQQLGVGHVADELLGSADLGRAVRAAHNQQPVGLLDAATRPARQAGVRLEDERVVPIGLRLQPVDKAVVVHKLLQLHIRARPFAHHPLHRLRRDVRHAAVLRQLGDQRQRKLRGRAVVCVRARWHNDGADGAWRLGPQRIKPCRRLAKALVRHLRRHPHHDFGVALRQPQEGFAREAANVAVAGGANGASIGLAREQRCVAKHRARGDRFAALFAKVGGELARQLFLVRNRRAHHFGALPALRRRPARRVDRPRRPR